MAAAVRHTVKLGTHKNALEEAGDQGFPFTKGPLVFETTGAMGGRDTEVVDVNCRDGGRPAHTRSTPEQSGARARAHVVSKQVLIVLATNVFNVTCQDASRIHSSVDRDLTEGLRANTASQCPCPP